MISNIFHSPEEKNLLSALFLSPVHIVRVDLDLLKKSLEQCGEKEIIRCYLSSKEKEQFSEYRYEKRKVEWLGGRVAAKCASLQLLHKTSQTSWKKAHCQRLVIAQEPNGKPVLYFCPDNQEKRAHISISHTKGIAVAAASWRCCGVDIQLVTESLERVKSRFVAGSEEQFIDTLTEQYDSRMSLALIWSAKEAIKKTAQAEHLPGFFEICLVSAQRENKGVRLKANVKVAGTGEEEIYTVWGNQVGGYSFALTCHGEEENGSQRAFNV